MKKRISISPVLKSTIHEIIILFFIVIWLIPAYAMVINSFKSNSFILVSPALVPPNRISFAAFTAVWGSLSGPIMNSMIIVLPVAIVSAFLGSMAAYYFDLLSTSLRRFNRYLSGTIFSIVALATFMPYQTTLIPLTRLMVYIGGFSTYWGLIFAFLIFYLPTGTLLMSMFISVVPARLTEAARIDGAGDLRIFTRVVFPTIIPGFLATLIFVVIEAWNVFFIPLVLINSPSLYVVSEAVQVYTGGFGTLYNQTFAASLLASLVPLALFVFLGRYFMKGLMALGSGGKGV